MGKFSPSGPSGNLFFSYGVIFLNIHKYSNSLLQRLERKFPILLDHLYEVATDEDTFSNEAREKAEELQGTLEDPNFCSLLHFQIDVLSLATAQSLHYQKESGTHIGEFQRQTQLRKDLESLKQGKGVHFKQFLQDTKCSDDEAAVEAFIESPDEIDLPSCKTLAAYEASIFKVYKAKLLHASSYTPLSTYLTSYVDKLLELQQSYFTNELDRMKLFDVFDPSKWRKRMPIGEQGLIQKLGSYFRIPNLGRLKSAWPIFRKAVTDSSLFCDNKDEIKSHPELFWAHVLNSATFDLTYEIRSLIEKILIVPVGSADAGKIIKICKLSIFTNNMKYFSERAFSVLNSLRGKSRHRLSPEVINDLLTIKINGNVIQIIQIKIV